MKKKCNNQKSFTDIDQSRRLAEILPLESADYYYAPDANVIVAEPYITKAGDETLIPAYKGAVPVWSLTALLGLMPRLYEFENDPDDGGCQPNLCKGWDNNMWHIVYRSSIYITEWYEDPIDAAFEMVCWLKENNKI